MRVGADLLTKAIYALEEAAQRSRFGKVDRTYALRFTLAWLKSTDALDDEPYREFWAALDDWNEVHRSRKAMGALDVICRRHGAARDEAMSRELWAKAQGEHEARRKGASGP